MPDRRLWQFAGDASRPHGGLRRANGASKAPDNHLVRSASPPHQLCGSKPMEKVVCSVVEAAGRVNMGAKVVVWL